MFKNKYMAHALGSYQGHYYSNSLEAFEHSIAVGYKYMEVDLVFTDDREVVCSHGWGKADCEKLGIKYQKDLKNMTRERFLAQKLHGMTTMDISGLYALMKKYPEVYMELDIHKLSGDDTYEMLNKVKQAFNSDTDALSRCLVQVHNDEMFKAASRIEEFKYYQLVIGKRIDLLDERIKYAKENGICALAMSRINITPKNVQKIKDAGLKILAFSVDDYDEAQYFLNLGIDTICTNSIEPDEEPRLMNFVYNSTPDVDECISELIEKNILRGELVRTSARSYEYAESVIISSKKPYRLVKCCYSRRGYEFAGWNARCRKGDDKWYWYSTAGKWQTAKDIDSSGNEKYCFSDCDIIDVDMLLEQTARVFLVAVWKSV